jgi:hypothetical protein
MSRRLALLAVLAALPAALLGCAETWQAQGGQATITVAGPLPWTDQEILSTSFTVAGENGEDVAILCGVFANGSYDVSASTTFVDGLKRLKVAVELPRYYGSSGYGTDGDPSKAWGRMTLRQDGDEGWFSADAGRFPCTGFIDEEQLRGEFECTGITGGTEANPDADGPMDFTLAYTCGRGSDLVEPDEE